ncbi:ferredoxin [Streptomyces microflavus]|uniref:ferredoxin n=1 Tax=Streptomyces microflavus TaxID=1919 RepID=UPI00365C5B38
MPGKYLVVADRQRCMGSGICVSVAPDTFALNEGRVTVLKNETDEVAAALDAEEICPAMAITIREHC